LWGGGAGGVGGTAGGGGEGGGGGGGLGTLAVCSSASSTESSVGTPAIPVSILTAAAMRGIHCDLDGEEDGDTVAATCPAPPTATFAGALAPSPIHF